MTEADIARVLAPILDEIETRSAIAERFVDKEVYRIYLGTIWANIVMDPLALGFGEDDLETVHDIINLQAAQFVGDIEAIKNAFEFINTKAGEAAMDKAKLSKNHRDLLLYFSSMILDPDGHKRWMDDVRN